MKKIIKKLLSLVLSAAMLLSILVGCGNVTPKQTDPTIKTPNIPTVSGILVLSTAASVKLTYDSEGMVTNVSGANDQGIALAAKYAYLGKSCSTAVKELIAASAAAGDLSPSVKNIVLKLTTGSSLPTELFLDTLTSSAEAAAKEAGSAAVVTAIGLDGLDENGYINADNAQTLLLNQLGIEKFDAVQGGTAPVDDQYQLTVEIDGIQSAYTVDAVTGLIEEASSNAPQDEGIEENLPEVDPTVEQNIEDTFDEQTEENIDETEA